MSKTPRPALHHVEYPLLEPELLELSQQKLTDEFIDVFLPDEGPEPLPERGDFWIERD